MRLICHIGAPKTGSTFLQAACEANAAWLARRGVVWPDMLCGSNHLTLYFAAAPKLHPFARDFGITSEAQIPAFRDKLAGHVRRQTRRRRMSAMVMSSEFLAGNLVQPEGIAVLQAMLAPLFPDGIRIVVYLRRQDDALLSLWGEHLRRGFSGLTWDDFVAGALAQPSKQPHLAYDRILDRWAAAFGEAALDVRLFDREAFARGDLLSDFMTAVLGPDADLDGMVRLPETNTGLSAPALEFLRRIYPHVPLYRDGKLNPARGVLRARIDALPAEPRPRMSRDQSERIMAFYGPGNARLAKRWFPGHPLPLFPPRRDIKPGNLGLIDLELFARFAGHLLA